MKTPFRSITMFQPLMWLALLLISSYAEAHTGPGAHTSLGGGWLHPLSGLDHLLAMLAIGAWSCQMGGRAIWIVPSAFVGSMILGGLLGFQQINLPGVELGITLSVVLLGLAIGLERTFPVVIAALAVGIFGLFHGYAHGHEMPVMDNKLTYTLGFVATTVTLHVVGAVTALLLLKLSSGSRILSLLGWACALSGAWLMFQLYQ